MIENFIVGSIDGDKFVICIGGVQVLCFIVECQICIYFVGIFDCCFQFDGFVIYYLNSIFFINIVNVDCVGRCIGNQFMGL